MKKWIVMILILMATSTVGCVATADGGSVKIQKDNSQMLDKQSIGNYSIQIEPSKGGI